MCLFILWVMSLFLQILDFSELNGITSKVQLKMLNKESGLIENTASIDDMMKTVNELLGVKCLFNKPSSTFYFQEYEGVKYGDEWGDRVSEEEAGCGRKMLRLHDNNLPYYGGRTYFSDGSKTPDFYDAGVYSYVRLMNTLKNICFGKFQKFPRKTLVISSF